ncbi:MAG: 4Fe-4S dicluster domain-containing protein [Gemmatimonadota bacterium]|nr:MAG: 4Fe-4S dicluster domain-containing protein [Gemmatimonadota bacterium]
MEPVTAQVLAKDRVGEWIERLMAEAEVIAPVLAHGGDEVFAPIRSPGEVLWEFTNPVHPPKRFLLPQTDPVVAIRRGDNGYELEAIVDERRRVLLNVRSCDVAGLAFLQHVHAADLPDRSYLERAAATTIVCLSCPDPCPLGFCICSGAGPFAREGYDLQLSDIGDLLLAEIGSERGGELLAATDGFFRPATLAEMAQRQQLEEKAKQLLSEQTCHFASAMRRVSTGRVAEDLWRKMSDWCLECGACNFVCPTCFCFSVKDRHNGDGWLRCRTWDSCQYPAFTLEASGHNPREERRDRIKRRFFHKVSAQYYQRDGMVGCVGCGRCVEVCLGTTDMPAVVAAIRKGEWHG